MQIQANDIVMYYELSGPDDGDVVMLSHSLGSNLSMWDPQVPTLEEAGFRVLRYDTRGHGGTEVTVGPYRLDQLVEDAVALLEALKIERIHFVGLSMGGMIAQGFALRHPERLYSLALCDTMAILPDDAQAVWAERIAVAREQGMAALVDATLARWFTADYLAADPAPVKLTRQAFLATPADGYIGCSEAVTRLNYLDRLSRITCPTLIVVGEDDPGTPPAAARAIQERIAGSELVILPSAAHLANLEQAEAFTRELLRFLEAHRGRS